MTTKTKISDIKLPVLKADNYAEWKIKITSLLKAKELFDIVEREPDETEMKDPEYEVENEMAKSVIYASLDGKTTQSAGICEHSYQLWQKVTNYYEGAKDELTGLALSRFMELKKENNEKIGDFLGRYEITLNNLRATTFVVDLTLMIYVLCKSMPTNIKEGIKVWRTMNEKGNIDGLLSYLRANYREEEKTAKQSAFFGNSKPNYNWKNGKSKYKGYNKSNIDRGTNKTNKGTSCTYCKKEGHIWKDCYKLKNENERKKNVQKERANMALERSYQTYQNYVPKNTGEWIIDSGATSHMTHNREVLMNYKKFDDPIEILVGDGESIFAEGKGWIFYYGNDGPNVLKDVLYVPKMAANLFSVKEAVKNGYTVNFANKKVEVRNKEEIIPAYYDGCLFLLNLKILNSGRQSANTAYSIETWHKRLAHCGIDLIKKMKKEHMVEGLDIGTDPTQCEDCIEGKSCRKPHPSRSQIKATEELAIIHFDTVDMNVESLGGSRYFVLGTEEYSGFKLINFVKKKSEITDCVKMIINGISINSRRPVACIYSDNGTEFVNNDLREWLSSRGIIHELSSPYNAEQNGRAEAANKSVITAARTTLISSKLPKKLWAEACSAAVYVLNRLPSIEKPNKTRYELFYGMKPNFSNLHEFGELVIRLIPKHQRTDKISSLTRRLRFVGYTSRFNTFRLYDEEKDKIIIDCNVRFTNRQPEEKVNREDPAEYVRIGWSEYLDTSKGKKSETTDDDMNISDITQIDTYDTSQNVNDAIHQEILSRSSMNTSNNSRIPRLSCDSDSTFQSTQQQLSDQPQQNLAPFPIRRVTRQQTNSLKPIYDPKSLIPPKNITLRRNRANIALYSLNDEPSTVKEAMECKDWDKWQIAMKEEIQALEENNTWTIVDKPPNVKPIKAKWIFKLKLNTDGSIDRYKARLVAKGYSQIPDVDYKETFAPVASMTTVRMMLAAAAQYDRKIIQFDIKTAFLYGDLDEEIYMECPEYYDAPKGKVCRLIKSLYGLKQAPRQWNKKFDSFLRKFNLLQSEYDRCLYYSKDRKIILTIYVDDGLIVAENQQLAMKLIEYLKEYLTVKTMDCKAYLGLEVIRNSDSIFITQRQYTEKTLEKFGMQDCKPSSTPEEVNQLDFANSPKLEEDFPFKELVGSLLYLVTCSRPDIAHAVSIASRTAEPTELHWNCLKRILRYLKGTCQLGILFKKENSPQLVGYSDADYANDKDTRRSTSGYVIYWGQNLIAWKCQRQQLVTLSTTEAEYIAGTEMVKKLIPLKAMMTELKLIEDEPVQVFIDNKSTINIVKNEQGQDRTKHIDVRHKWLNEHHDLGNIKISHISGEEQKADILTKPLHKSKFELNRKWLMTFLLTMMCSILLNINTTEPLYFKQTKPVYYKMSNSFIYKTGDQRVHYKILFQNPCPIFFMNITKSPVVNKKLIDQCQESFEKATKINYCNGSINPLSNNQLDFEAEIEQESNIIKTQENKDLTQRYTTIQPARIKRIAPAYGIVVLIMMAGLQIKTARQSNINLNNIETLMKSFNDERKFLEEGKVLLGEIRKNIHHLNFEATEIAGRVAKIEKFLEKMPNVIALVYKYGTIFAEYSDMISQMDNAARNHQASSAIFKLTKDDYWIDKPIEHVYLESCYEELSLDLKDNISNFVLHYQITLPKTDKNVMIMEAEAFRFWNITKPDLYCWMRYAGPKYILVNQTNNCHTDCRSYWMDGKVVSGHPCLEENRQLESLRHLYHIELCKDKFIGDPDDIQIKRFNGFTKIYCYGNNITVENKIYPCPDYVFEFPVSQKMTLAGETHDLSSVTHVSVNTIELQINNQLAEETNLNNLKIYGINTTAMDLSWSRITMLTPQAFKNITLIDSPIELFSLSETALKEQLTGLLRGSHEQENALTNHKLKDI